MKVGMAINDTGDHKGAVVVYKRALGKGGDSLDAEIM
jgi:hypothetical protein